MLNIELKTLEINDVFGAVWLATAILTYEKYLTTKINMDEKLTIKDIAFSQLEIRKLASKICPKKINSARISQWCNADHPNHLRNYLKEVGNLRRITIPGEHQGKREMPQNLLDSNKILFVNPFSNEECLYLELLNWIRFDLKRFLSSSPNVKHI